VLSASGVQGRSRRRNFGYPSDHPVFGDRFELHIGVNMATWAVDLCSTIELT
jgi:hypothetical protein